MIINCQQRLHLMRNDIVYQMKVINSGSIENSSSKHFDLNTMKRDYSVWRNAMQIQNVSDVCWLNRDENSSLSFVFLGKYSEPLKSLLDQLSERLSHTSVKRPPAYEPTNVNNKRNATMLK